MILDREQKAIEFKAIRLKLGSPEDILGWSHGEVLKPETVNYRTQKPEKDGLFCEKIFGPTKDWECYCGKYKKVRYKGIVCDKCGVEVTRSVVRRERMGHIKLAAPVSHIWFLRGVPSKIGLILDLSIQDLEKVIYFANYIITHVDDTLREETLKQIDVEHQAKKKSIEAEFSRIANDIKQRRAKDVEEEKEGAKKSTFIKELDEELAANSQMRDEKLRDLGEAVDLAKRELKGLRPLQIISEQMYRDLSLKYGHVFEASIGAEAVHELLRAIDLSSEIVRLEAEVLSAPEGKRRRAVRRLKLFKNLQINKLRPEWMILTVIPVIPPDLRPMVQLDGGRFAASDLNDLYRRVINRNNRLKRLIALNAPEVIQRNEKRMLQEAVDALIDNNARHGKTVTASTGQKRMLKSIADILKGKQGRFRQNLLGKRVDYSGRSVIVVGPHLKMDECGLPKRMALELFKPFIISQLIKREFVHNVRSASRFIEAGRAEVWDILEEVTRGAHVLLNRAPTLHRLGIQAFRPVLIEGKAIQIHPLVCPAFNADFDGDQMAVHVPLTENAKKEAADLIASIKNLLKPSTGSPIISPTQDIVLGCYYLTMMKQHPAETLKSFCSVEETLTAYQLGRIHIQDEVRVKIGKEMFLTSSGRIIFNSVLPAGTGFINEVIDRRSLTKLISTFLHKLPREEVVILLDKVKKLSFRYLTTSGISWGMGDLVTPDDKYMIIHEAETLLDEVQAHYEQGLLTNDERHMKVIELWAQAKDRIQKASREALNPQGSVFSMIESGARGSWAQTTQMMGMKGLVTNPAGETIELPVRGSFKEGFDVLEYFISTHGARKGLSDTALRTANAGYLTRRLIDVSQDVIITEEDCGDTEGFLITRAESDQMGEDFENRMLGRAPVEDIIDPKGKKVLVKASQVITESDLPKIAKLKLAELKIRSSLRCKTRWGLCQTCYGYDLGFNKTVEFGTAIGIIAAQSIGEPGTQLTMRTFHTGGVAGQDITQGLPRVEELFEARPIRRPALIAGVTGKASIVDEGKNMKKIVVAHRGIDETEYPLPKRTKGITVKVKDGETVNADQVLYIDGTTEIKARLGGTARVANGKITIVAERDKKKEYQVPTGQLPWIKDGDLVNVGDQLTDGSLDLHQLFYLSGQEAVERYILKEIQYIYSSQGQKLNDKHIEIVIRQMFSRVYIKEPGDTSFLSGEIIERTRFVEANDEAKKKGGKPAIGEQLLLGITKASLSIDSFLSAASFQETARVLIDAAVSGKVDHLRGLKENVIIGKLIPAGTGFHRT
ncbi:MAG: DNA-directed RNA polymerase subunit beta' [Patescibacteria group bacterium]|nr:DNA-directed RNA polymerase subunit beta' [Patescibacteria group bacterium]MDD5715852.1 DNA-directed RNA polymerase subunit beta' [Patescibacteria group bacterium]